MSGGGANEILDLSHAMKFADAIRKHYEDDEDKKKNFNGSFAPGIVQGASAALFAGVALLPVRRAVLRQVGDTPIRTFTDLLLSVSQVLVATQVGLMVGSVFGCQAYLQDFAKATVTTQESALSDRICDTVWKSVLPKGYSADLGQKNLVVQNPPAPWDIRTQTLIDLQKAILCCQRRQEFSGNPTD